MSAFNSLETSLNKVFVKNAPFQLPAGLKKWLVKYLPYINLVLGILSLLAALSLYKWARDADKVVNYVNDIYRAYGVNETASVERFTIAVWGSLLVLAVMGVLYVMAFSPTKARQKRGWDLLFYALLINVVYGVVVSFTDYGGTNNIISTVISTVIGLYFLFQIRDAYNGKKSA